MTSDPRYRDMARARKAKALVEEVRHNAEKDGVDPSSAEFVEGVASWPLSKWEEVAAKAGTRKPSSVTVAQAVLMLRKQAEAAREQLAADLSGIEEGP
jgi:hypothetical protein